MDDSTRRLSAELEAALLRELLQTYHELNHSHFREALTTPTLRLADGTSTLGRWERATRSIELSRSLVLEQPWLTVVEVLKHEMAHQYTHEILGAVDETAHGPAFRSVCERLGIDGAATGLPTAPDPTRAKILERVEGLLRLAQSDNQHEAENAAALAQRLMLKHNIEVTASPERSRYGFRTVGAPKGRHHEAEHILAAILGQYFFVEAIWVPAYRPHDGKRGNVLELTGTAENLEIATYVHGFLLETSERLWKAHKKAHGIRLDRDRRRFVAGVMEGFRERLASEKRSHEERGLVWIGDPELQRFYRQRHPHVRSVRVKGHGLSEARLRGRAAGRNIVLRQGLDPSAQQRGRALPPKR